MVPPILIQINNKTFRKFAHPEYSTPCGGRIPLGVWGVRVEIVFHFAFI
jgi:hypothetical protein